MQDGKRAILLDIFRIILCIGVVVYHFSPERVSSGPFVVIVFFVMSGFLLGVGFQRSESIKVEAFYKHKAVRLLPMFLLALSMGIVAAYMRSCLCPAEFTFMPALSSDVWLGLNLSVLIEHFNVPLWYMAVEFQLLICAPLLYCLFKRPTGWTMYSLLGLSILMAMYQYSFLPEKPVLFAGGLYYSVTYRFYQFIAGLVAAYIYCQNVRRNQQLISEKSKCVLTYFLFAVFCILVVLLMILKQVRDLSAFNYSFLFDVCSVAFFTILIPLLYSVKIKCSPSWSNAIVYMAALTYPIYLTHDLAYGVRRIPELVFGLDLPNIVGVVVALAISFVTSILMLHYQKKIFG